LLVFFLADTLFDFFEFLELHRWLDLVFGRIVDLGLDKDRVRL
jgi:hypothetical protein